LVSGEWHYLIWDTVAQSTNWLNILQIWGRGPLGPLATPMVTVALPNFKSTSKQAENHPKVSGKLRIREIPKSTKIIIQRNQEKYFVDKSHNSLKIVTVTWTAKGNLLLENRRCLKLSSYVLPNFNIKSKQLEPNAISCSSKHCSLKFFCKANVDLAFISLYTVNLIHKAAKLVTQVLTRSSLVKWQPRQLDPLKFYCLHPLTFR